MGNENSFNPGTHTHTASLESGTAMQFAWRTVTNTFVLIPASEWLGAVGGAEALRVMCGGAMHGTPQTSLFLKTSPWPVCGELQRWEVHFSVLHWSSVSCSSFLLELPKIPDRHRPLVRRNYEIWRRVSFWAWQGKERQALSEPLPLPQDIGIKNCSQSLKPAKHNSEIFLGKYKIIQMAFECYAGLSFPLKLFLSGRKWFC